MSKNTSSDVVSFKNDEVREPKSKKPVEDIEVKDSQLIFQSVWHELEKEVGVENLKFPAEIFWLNGAPGAGKGTQTAFIMEFRDLTEKPIVVSELLQSPEAKKKIDAGLLAGDREVTKLVLRELLDPKYESGAVVDGYPRTKTQVLAHAFNPTDPTSLNRPDSPTAAAIGSAPAAMFHSPSGSYARRSIRFTRV